MKYIIPIILSLIVGCSSSDYQANDSDRGAAAGAVVGGGLGAVIGSQSGSTAGGLALGTIAGAGVGAMIGHRFQEKDDVIDTQAETIQQQQRQLQLHQNEVDQLRRSTQDQVSFTGNPPASNLVIEKDLKESFPQSTNHLASSKIAESNFERAPVALESAPIEVPTAMPVEEIEQIQEVKVIEPIISETAIIESEPVVVAKVDVAPVPQQELPKVQAIQEMDTRAAYNWNQETTTASAPSVTPECQEAKKEISSAGQAEITAEKLYHFRRAQRLCPEDLTVHTGLGKVYLELDRKDEARHELQEALKRDPENQEAKDLMNKL